MINAIETRYAGCRFRSRLEARWAVFFDTLGIRWEYEPQGFVIDGQTYLPDFLLPQCGTWVEVKGHAEDLDHKLLEAAARVLPALKPHYESGPRLLVLGPIPEPREGADWGWLGLEPVEVYEGYTEVFGNWWGFGNWHKNLRPWQLCNTSTATAYDAGDPDWLTPALDQYEDGVPAAYTAARSARFEHGETP